MDSMLSQEEINALLNGIENGSSDSKGLVMLSDEEKDAIGEISNISMGTAATTLSTLLDKKVTITAPVVGYSTWEEISSSYARPCVLVQISYKDGLSGDNILILEQRDVSIISDLMMGGDAQNIVDELTELQLSAISEAMNQMMGSSATSLSTLLDRKIDISPPNARVLDAENDIDPSELEPFLSETFVKVSFKMEVDGLIDSQIMQLYPMQFAKELYNKFVKERSLKQEENVMPHEPEKVNEQPRQNVPNASAMQQTPTVQQPMQQPPQMEMPQMQYQQPQPMQYQPQPQYQQPQMGMPQMPIQQPIQYQQPQYQQPNVNVAPAQFAAFGNMINPALQNENIDLIMDVPLEVTVELGRTNKSIKEILEFKPGTIVELNKIAGEPIDILVNGKFVAKGEVVVIDECFGIRITEITK